MKLLTPFIAIAVLTACSACSTISSATSKGPRTIILDGQTFTEQEVGDFVSWRCVDFSYGGKTLVEVGMITNEGLSETGFVLYDGGYNGDLTSYQRRGLNRRWDWGPNGADYAFVLKPDGTGAFYDFSLAKKGEGISANEVYKCHD
jgi:hypothetical protein